MAVAEVNSANSSKQELSHRAREFARERDLPYCLSYGRSPTVCFEAYADSRHGQFSAGYLPRHTQEPELATPFAESPIPKVASRYRDRRTAFVVNLMPVRVPMLC